MSKKWIGMIGLAATLVCVGCTRGNSSIANGITRSEIFHGALGITGHENNYTLETGSAVERLSIIGDANRVTVQWGAKLGKIEIWGSNNVVLLPKYLIVRKSVVGSNNQFLDTPEDQYSGYRGYRAYTPPGYGPPPTTYAPVEPAPMPSPTAPPPAYEPAPSPGTQMVPVNTQR